MERKKGRKKERRKECKRTRTNSVQPSFRFRCRCRCRCYGHRHRHRHCHPSIRFSSMKQVFTRIASQPTTCPMAHALPCHAMPNHVLTISPIAVRLRRHVEGKVSSEYVEVFQQSCRTHIYISSACCCPIYHSFPHPPLPYLPPSLLPSTTAPMTIQKRTHT